MKSRHSRASKKNGGFIRIIAGAWRGRKLQVLTLDGLRPTGDRVKEMLFNWLTADIVHSRCLDVFAGTGSLGLESLSRGASSVTFIEANPRACQQLKQHVQTLNATDKASVYAQDALTYLTRRAQAPFDVIFLDPPFAKDCIAEVLTLLQDNYYLHTQTKIYIEQPVSDNPHTLPSSAQVIKEKVIGQVLCRIIQIHKASEK